MMGLMPLYKEDEMGDLSLRAHTKEGHVSTYT